MLQFVIYVMYQLTEACAGHKITNKQNLPNIILLLLFIPDVITVILNLDVEALELWCGVSKPLSKLHQLVSFSSCTSFAIYFALSDLCNNLHFWVLKM